MRSLRVQARRVLFATSLGLRRFRRTPNYHVRESYTIIYLYNSHKDSSLIILNQLVSPLRIHSINMSNNTLEANYEFMKKSPVYLELKAKYKALKRRNEQLVEMMLDMRGLLEDSVRTRVESRGCLESRGPAVPVVIKQERVVETIDLVESKDTQVRFIDESSQTHEDPKEKVTLQETVEEEVVEEEVVEEEVVEEETVEEEVVEEEEGEEEEEGVYEIEISGTRYYTTNEQSGQVYAVLEDDEIGDLVGRFENGVFIRNT